MHNNEMNLAWQFVVDTNMSVFLTGKAGTGKTTFLRKLKELAPKRMIVVAPTGVAAINAGGQTIHSFFQLPLTPHVPSLYVPGAPIYNKEKGNHFRMSKEKKNIMRSLDLLVIDEISMVRCDVLDAIDDVLRKYKDRTKPFGGVQLLLIGDLQQLAPVAKDEEWSLLGRYYDTPYFFSSKALQQIKSVTIELQHIYRQTDSSFIDILAQIRENRIDTNTMQALADRYVPDFIPPKDDEWIRLTTHNYMAQRYNDQQLALLDSREMTFRSEVKGNFPEYSYPTDSELRLKVGAQVMFVKNDASGNMRYFNGKIGIVTSVTANGISVQCKGDESPILVEQAEWENMKYEIDDKTKEIKETVDGVFKQYPLRLAWAITVHKSQGLTFDHAVLDINDAFTHGQVYVALSRCRTLDGLVLARPLDMKGIITDEKVNEYIKHEHEMMKQTQAMLASMKQEYFATMLDELFDYSKLASDLHYFVRVVNEHLMSSNPKFASDLIEAEVTCDQKIRTIADKYRLVCRTTVDQERIKRAATYFVTQLSEIFMPIFDRALLKIDNKTVKQQYNNAFESLAQSYLVKVATMSGAAEDGFSVSRYLSDKSKASLIELPVRSSSAKAGRPAASRRKALSTDNPPKEKKQRVDTRKLTLQMFQSGMTIKEIAVQRSLTVSTIENHLALFVSDGTIALDEVVTPEHQAKIREVISSFKTAYSLSEVKEKLPDDYTYAEIKMVSNS